MKTGVCKLEAIGYSYGVVHELEVMKDEGNVIPSSVHLMLGGKKLLPTQFDAKGHPQIGGVAHLMLTWQIRQLVRDGVFDSQYSAMVDYQYETTHKPINISISQRLPREDTCPICGESFTTEDLDQMNVTELSGEYTLAHNQCSKEFYRFQMIDKITEMVELVFSSYSVDENIRATWGKGLSYQLIPNEYCSGECCNHRPWFLFSTPVGDIKIGWRKRVINITWMENFAPFDMSIFDDEKTTKYINETWFDGEPPVKGPIKGQRSIHAWSYQKFYEYLKKVHEQVLPNKKKD